MLFLWFALLLLLKHHIKIYNTFLLINLLLLPLCPRAPTFKSSITRSDLILRSVTQHRDWPDYAFMISIWTLLHKHAACCSLTSFTLIYSQKSTFTFISSATRSLPEQLSQTHLNRWWLWAANVSDSKWLKTFGLIHVGIMGCYVCLNKRCVLILFITYNKKLKMLSGSCLTCSGVFSLWLLKCASQECLPSPQMNSRNFNWLNNLTVRENHLQVANCRSKHHAGLSWLAFPKIQPMIPLINKKQKSSWTPNSIAWSAGEFCSTWCQSTQVQ